MGTSILTRSGKLFDFMAPSADAICLEDICHNLAGIRRYTGAVDWSVAQHTLLVAHLVDDDHRFWALLHDAHEAYLGDISSPLKTAISVMSDDGEGPIEKMIDVLDSIICAKFGCERTYESFNAVLAADRYALAIEVNYFDLHPKHDAWPVAVREAEIDVWTRGLMAAIECCDAGDWLRGAIEGEIGA